MKVTSTLTLDKSTPNTHVYKDSSTDAAVPSIYIKKSAFPDGDPPREITIEIKAAGSKK